MAKLNCDISDRKLYNNEEEWTRSITTIQNLWDAARVVLRSSQRLQAFLKKQEKS